jgi:hypothetical protein
MSALVAGWLRPRITGIGTANADLNPNLIKYNQILRNGTATWHTSYFSWACCVLFVNTVPVYSRPLMSFIYHPDRNTISSPLSPFKPQSNLSKQLKKQQTSWIITLFPITPHYCVGTLTFPSPWDDRRLRPSGLSIMFDNLVLDQNPSALDPDLRPSVSSVHLTDQSNSVASCVRVNIWNTSMAKGLRSSS